LPLLESGRGKRQLGGTALIAAVLRHVGNVRSIPHPAEIRLAIRQARRRFRLLRGGCNRDSERKGGQRALHHQPLSSHFFWICASLMIRIKREMSFDGGDSGNDLTYAKRSISCASERTLVVYGGI